MSDILKEILNFETDEEELEKIVEMNKTLKQMSDEVVANKQTHLTHITETFVNKLKTNPNFIYVVNNYVDKYVEEKKKNEAREELYLILAGELLGVCRGLNHTNCTVM